jgi:hypothetical protein
VSEEEPDIGAKAEYFNRIKHVNGCLTRISSGQKWYRLTYIPIESAGPL